MNFPRIFLGESHRVVKHNNVTLKSPHFRTASEMAESFLTNERLDQAVCEVTSSCTNTLVFSNDKNLEMLTDWLEKDIHKEARVDLEQNAIPWELIQQQIKDRVSKWFLKEKLKYMENGLKSMSIHQNEPKMKSREQKVEKKPKSKVQEMKIPVNSFDVLSLLEEE